MLGRNSTSTTRTTSTGCSEPATVGTTNSSTMRKKKFGSKFGLRRLHPDHTNPSLRTKINDPNVSSAQAREAQRELAMRDEVVPKRSLGTKFKRLSNKWRTSGTATSRTTPKTY